MTGTDERRAAWLAKLKVSKAELEQAEAELGEVPPEVAAVLEMIDLEISHADAQGVEPEAEPPQIE